jgi:hypothetical protein
VIGASTHNREKEKLRRRLTICENGYREAVAASCAHTNSEQNTSTQAEKPHFEFLMPAKTSPISAKTTFHITSKAKQGARGEGRDTRRRIKTVMSNS